MYRRNIRHILAPLALVISLFVLYQAWLKPHYFPEPPPLPPSHQVSGETSPGSPSIPLVSAQEHPSVEIKRLRTIDPVSIPVPRHSELLGAIHEELEKRNLAVAESKLEELPPSLFTESATKRHVAILWNNLGILQEKIGGTEVSVKAFKKAVSFDPQNPVAHLNLANAYWGLRDPALSEDFLKKVLSLAPDEPFPHVALADLLQERERFTEAEKHLTQARERIKKDPGLQSYLKAVTTKVRRGEKGEGKLLSHSSIHFTVKYDGSEDAATWTSVLDILEEAYREIGQKFNFFPVKTITVVLHTKTQLQELASSPKWADGLFDPILGRIQIPTQGAATGLARITRILRHEFVHALLHEQLEASGGVIPTWLNEGLAMELAGDAWHDLRILEPGEQHLVPLTALEGNWESLSEEEANTAYAEAGAATHYLIQRFGMNKVHELLLHLKNRQTIAAAMQDRLLLSYDRFQQQWADSVGGTLVQQQS
ncbi:MAG TPA: hypothetical protein VM842_06530 [Nitrospira sp.]|nr:hypothetical protein [Nitrospira sp.]